MNNLLHPSRLDFDGRLSSVRQEDVLQQDRRRRDQRLHEQLEEAMALAQAGVPNQARVVLAGLVFTHQPRLAEDRALLCDTITALIHARGFHLLGRLLAAMDGRKIKVTLRVEAVPGFVARTDIDGVIHYNVSDGLFAEPAAMARWTHELAGGPPQQDAARSAA